MVMYCWWHKKAVGACGIRFVGFECGFRCPRVSGRDPTSPPLCNDSVVTSCTVYMSLFCVCVFSFHYFLIAHATIIKFLGFGWSFYNSNLAGVYPRKFIVYLLEELCDYFCIWGISKVSLVILDQV